jgi:hypothetical protein
MEVHTKLQPYNMSVASHLQPTDERRQRGEVLPEYHAVLLHQAMPYLDTADTGTGAGRDGALVLLARKIAPMSQIEARAYIEAVKDGRESLDDPVSQHVDGESPPSWHFKSVRHGSSRRSKAAAKQGMDGGLVTCSCCNRVLKLNHRADGTHTITDTPFTGQPKLPEPDVPLEPVAAALNPAPALEASGTIEPILKQTAGYTINSFPKGLNSVLNLQTTGFWGKLSQSPANPDFIETDIPQSIWTVDPWVGCLWGVS